MSVFRPATLGKTRPCPHCKAFILESLGICPACNGHVRFDKEAEKRLALAQTALRVDGDIRHPQGEAAEYCILISVRNERGDEIARQVVNVGALKAAEKRTFSLKVDVLPPPGGVPKR